MTDMTVLYRLVKQLNADEWQALKEFLDQHPPIELMQQTTPVADDSPRVPGLFAEQGGWVSPDFNAELPDEFWGWDK